MTASEGCEKNEGAKRYISVINKQNNREISVVCQRSLPARRQLINYGTTRQDSTTVRNPLLDVRDI